MKGMAVDWFSSPSPLSLFPSPVNRGSSFCVRPTYPSPEEWVYVYRGVLGPLRFGRSSSCAPKTSTSFLLFILGHRRFCVHEILR